MGIKGTVLFKSAIKPGIKQNFEVYNVLEFLSALTSHIPQAGKKIVIYYGWYYKRLEAKRKESEWR